VTDKHDAPSPGAEGMPDVNITQLRTFLAVIDHGSFSDAAKVLGISQPAVTMQLQTLEADLGVTLLDRRYRRIDLTESGRLLEPHARRTLAEVDSARDELAQLSGDVGGQLEIAASTTPGVYVIPRLLGAFLSANPAVSVTVTVHDTADVIAAVEEGRAQIGVVGAVVKGAKVAFKEFAEDELIAICPPSSPFAAKRGVKLSALADADWVAREPGSGTGVMVERELAAAGVDPTRLRVVAQLGTGEAIVSAIEGGLGIAMVSLLVAEKALAQGTVARIDLAGARLRRPLYVVLPKGTPTRAATAFNAHLQLKRDG
jgi:DNA-binding transcriptional LysR family regulator